MTDDAVFTAATGQGLVVSTGILGDLVLPEGTFDPDRADGIRDLAAQVAVYATQARGPGTLRAYRSAWRQYDAWCTRLGLPAPQLPVVNRKAPACETTRPGRGSAVR
jgi:hypothetical protein